MQGILRSYGALVRHAGNEALRQAVELSALGIMKGYALHLHAEGLRGTGKTTIMRAARALLPPILRVRGCLYNCDPRAPHCPAHRNLSPAGVLQVGTEWVPAPFLEISPSAKIGTVVGSIDLGRLTDRISPEAALLPGTLAQAHRGVVFIDEINRLADVSPELADALLDVMGTKPGRLQIEETGLPRVELESRVTIWAASNPDEEPGPLSDIRRQLADRFDLAVAMRRPADPDDVVSMLAVDEFRPTPADADITPATPELARELRVRAARAVPPLGADLRRMLGEVYCGFQLESLRAVQAWQAAARLAALADGADAVRPEHLSAVAPSVLRHRLEPDELARALAFLRQDPDARQAQEMAGAAAAPPPEVPGPAETKGHSPWSDFLSRLRGQREGAAGTGSAGGGQGTAATGARRGGSGAGAGGVPGLADPDDVPLFAPPGVAVPLPALPEGRWLERASGPADSGRL